MHGGFGDGLIAPIFIILIGAFSFFLFFCSIVASKKSSIHGIKGLMLFLLSLILLVSLGIAINNFLWDVLRSYSDITNVALCSIVSYLLPLPFLRVLYFKRNEKYINKALIISMILVATLFGAWFIAETV